MTRNAGSPQLALVTITKNKKQWQLTRLRGQALSRAIHTQLIQFSLHNSSLHREEVPPPHLQDGTVEARDINDPPSRLSGEAGSDTKHLVLWPHFSPQNSFMQATRRQELEVISSRSV